METMNTKTDLLLDLNILSRATQKYYDRQLQEFDLTYAQLPVLLMIYESEGITANQIVIKGQYDKGTVTKNVQKLESLGYIQSRASLTDKRVRHLYPTDRTKAIISRIYAIRRDWWDHLMNAIPDQDTEEFMDQTRKMVESAVEASNTRAAPVIFYREETLSAFAWPGRLAMVLYTAGCNFRCPGCPETQRVVLPEDARIVDASRTLSELQQRRHFLDGVVIAGGEPFLQAGMIPFLRELKKTGAAIRVQTNGTTWQQIKDCLQENLVDSWSLRLRNSPHNYALSAGLSAFDVSPVEKTMALLTEAKADWEAVLEVDDGYFDDADLELLKTWTATAPHVRVINHTKAPHGIDPDLGPMDAGRYRQWKEKLER